MHEAQSEVIAPKVAARSFASPVHPDGYQCLGEYLASCLSTWKEHEALAEWNRNRCLSRKTYADVQREALALAGFLANEGVRSGTRVAVLLPNQSRWLISAIAIFFAGGVLVPIDYKMSAEEQLALLAHAEVDWLITESSFVTRFSKSASEASIASLPFRFLIADDQSLGAAFETRATLFSEGLTHEPLATLVHRELSDVATLVYSSGTSGSPKGCMMPHRAYLSQVAALMELFVLRPEHRFFSVLPTNHAIDFMVGFLGPFACGAQVVHQKTLRPEFLVSTMKSEKITHIALVPLLLEAFERAIDEKLSERSSATQFAFSVLERLNAGATRYAADRRLSRALLAPVHQAFGGALEMIFCGGAYVEPKRAKRFYEWGIPVVIGYGLTEACTVATLNDLKPFREDTVGRPVPGVEVRLVDCDSDGTGKVELRGPVVMLGYWKDSEATQEAFATDGWLKTGDIGYFDGSGHLRLVGRAKNMIVTRGGKNVYPEDIEPAFASIPAKEIAIFASGYLFRESPLAERLVVVVREKQVEGETSTITRERVHQAIERANRSLPDYRRVQAVLYFADDFPRTASMKIKREVLAKEISAAMKVEEIQELKVSAPGSERFHGLRSL